MGQSFNPEHCKASGLNCHSRPLRVINLWSGLVVPKKEPRARCLWACLRMLVPPPCWDVLLTCLPTTPRAPPADTQPSVEAESNCSHQQPSHSSGFPALSREWGWPWGTSNKNQLALSFKPKALLSHLTSVSCKGPTLAGWAPEKSPKRGGHPWATYPRLPPALHCAVMLPNHSSPGSELSGPFLLVCCLYKTEAGLQVSASQAFVAPWMPTVH